MQLTCRSIQPSRTAAPTQRRRTREHGAAQHGPPQQSRAATRHGLAQRAWRAARPTQRSAMLGRTSSRIGRKLLEPDELSTRRSWLPCRCDSLGDWASSLASLRSGFRPLYDRHSQQASGPSRSQAPSEPNWRAHQTRSTAGQKASGSSLSQARFATFASNWRTQASQTGSTARVAECDDALGP